MKLHYKLLPHSNRGLLQTPDTPLLDIDSGFSLAFDLPEPGEYVAVLTGQDGREQMLRISAEPVPLPPHMVKPQLIAVAVMQLKDGKPHKRWVCPAARITSLAAMGKLIFQAVEDTAGLADDIKWLYSAVDGMRGEIAALNARIAVLEAEAAEQGETLTNAYNNSVEAHNALEERVTQIEAKYDPVRMR